MAISIICESDKIIVKQTGKVISLMLKTNATPTVCLQCHQKMSLSKMRIMFNDNAQGNKHEQQ